MQTPFEPHRVGVVAHMVDTALLELNAAAVRVVPSLDSKLPEMEMVTHDAQRVALLPPEHICRRPREPPSWRGYRRGGRDGGGGTSH